MKNKTDWLERREMRLQDVEFRLSGETGAPIVEGYAAVFNSLSEPLFEWDNGKFREKIVSGAFARTIRNQNIPLLVEHADLPLATTKAGTLKLSEDERGLRFYSELEPSDPDVQRIVPKMRRGDLNKMSFGFIPVRQSWDEATKPRTRILHEVKLFDVSIVATPAYPATEAKVRKALADDGLDAERIADLLVRLRQGLELEDDDMVLLRCLAETCQRRLSESATAPDADPHPMEHSADGMHPATISASGSVLSGHPLSYYRERLEAAKQRNSAEV